MPWASPLGDRSKIPLTSILWRLGFVRVSHWYGRYAWTFPAFGSKNLVRTKESSSWWFQPIWKILVKMDHSPRGENKKYWKPPPSHESLKQNNCSTDASAWLESMRTKQKHIKNQCHQRWVSAVVFKVLSEERDIGLKQAESAVGGVTQAIVAAHPGVDMPGNRLWNNQKWWGDEWSPTRNWG